MLAGFYSDSPDMLGYPVNFTTVDGPAQATWYDLDGYMDDQIAYAAVYSVRIGAGSVFLVCFLLFSRRYRSPVFWLNLASLVLLLLHSILYLVFLLGPFNSMSTNFTGSYHNVTYGDLATQVAGSIFQTLITVFVLCSLLFQSWNLFADWPRFQWIASGLLAVLVATPVVVLRVWLTVLTARAVYDPIALAMVESDAWLIDAVNPAFAAAISIFTLLLATKLLLAIRRRRKLGLTNFDPMRIVFIVMVQTMIIPAIFSILQSVLPGNAPLSAITTMLVVVFLPFSSVWAQFQITNSDVRGHAVMLPLSPAGSDATKVPDDPFLSSATASPVTAKYSGLAIHSQRHVHRHDLEMGSPDADALTIARVLSHHRGAPFTDQHSTKELL